MGAKYALFILVAVAVGIGMAAGVVLAQPPQQTVPVPTANPPAGGKIRDWYDAADIVFRVITIIVLSGGLLGTFALLTSLRAGAYSQIYTRFQGLLLKLADHPELFDRMKEEVYTPEEDDLSNPKSKTNPHRFIANAMVNLYEEAFLLYESRVLSFIDPLPADYWQSILGSMRGAFQLKYVRTHWERRQAVFSAKFNQFVKSEIIAYTGPQPPADVV